MATPTPKTSVGTLFQQQLTQLAKYAEAQDAASRNQAPPTWYRPVEFTATLTDVAAYHAPFSREQQETEFDETVKDPQDAGTVGDLQMVLVQGDYLHTMERAFRSRHHTSIRRRMHATARHRGHAVESGVVLAGILGYVVNLDRLNKGETQ